MTWLASVNGLIGRIAASKGHPLSPERVATALYRGILEREPDLPGLANKAELLHSADILEQVIRSFIDSPEFRSRFLASVVPSVDLPDLTVAMPERYETQKAGAGPMTVYIARHKSDVYLMEGLIEKHRFYDRFGVWIPVIDLDKQITAATVSGLGARSCFEMGCFTGPVLSLLADAGVTVLGSEVSHLAFTFAYPNIRDAMLFGDLLSLRIDRVFDVVLCMDVLEHLNPELLDDYLKRLISLLDPDGYLYVNSPMWGRDRIFGVFEEPYLAEWHAVAGESFWRHWPCDEKGWPLHGHLIWASPLWWERKFAEHGMIRDVAVERALHSVLAPVFEQTTGRRSLFVLRRRTSRCSSEAVAANLVRELSQVPGLAAGTAA